MSSKRHQTVSVMLSPDLIEMLDSIVDQHLGLTRHAVHRAAVRIGLRRLKADEQALRDEVAAMRSRTGKAA